MATLEQLDEMRRARAGDAAAQIALAKRYLRGDVGLSRNPVTAMLWLDMAARNGHEEAWTLLGQETFLEVAETSNDLRKILVWFEHAFAAGVDGAGIAFARIVLRHFPNEPVLFRKALSVLDVAARAGNAEAQWLLAKQMLAGLSKPDIAQPGAPATEPEDLSSRVWDLAKHAADSGIVDAQYTLADRAWSEGDTETFLHWALPLARQFIHRQSAAITTPNPILDSRRPGNSEATLLFRCALTLRKLGGNDEEISRFVEHAARKGDPLAQLSLGLWWAKLDIAETPLAPNLGHANYKMALSWLNLSGDQGLPQAWYFASQIYLKAQFSGRSVRLAELLLRRAAASGHVASQMECAIRAWRDRQHDPYGDVTAAYWLQQASAQGCAEADAMIEKIAPSGHDARWAEDLLRRLSSEDRRSEPFLATRVELAAAFGLSESEALLIDPNMADQGHCLLVEHHPTTRQKSKRRLILVTNEEQRQILDRAKQLFKPVECSANGPEGNYRKRHNRLARLARNDLANVRKPTPMQK